MGEKAVLTGAGSDQQIAELDAALAEIEATLDDDVDTLIVGAGLFGQVRLAPDAQAYLEQRACSVELRPIKQAVRLWNVSQGKVMGLFHITC